MIANLRDLVEACLGLHLEHGPKGCFSWAIYATPEGACTIAIAPSNPPVWEGDMEGMERAKKHLAQIFATVGLNPSTLPATAPSASWTPSSAHERLIQAQRIPTLTQGLADTIQR